MARLSLAVATAALLVAAAAAAAVATNTTAVARAASAAGRTPRRTRSCDPTVVLCVETDPGYSPSFQEPRFYSVGVQRLPFPVVSGAPLLHSYHLAPPVFPLVPPPPAPVEPPPEVRFIPPPALPFIPPPAVQFIPPPSLPFIPPPAVQFIPPPAVPFNPPPAVPFLPPPAVPFIPPPAVRFIPPPAVPFIPPPAVISVLPEVTPVIRQPYPVAPRPYPVAPRPYPVVPRPNPSDSGTRLFPTYPATLPRLPAQTDIRSFYQSAVLVGDGVVHQGDSTTELICDFTTNGPYPSSDILTDVVWQKVGANGVYLNKPMTSGAENALNCPRNYVAPPPVNYGFNVVGTRTSLVIQNARARDYGTYRCYATRVNRLNPGDRHPVYMEIRFTGQTPRTGLVG